MSQRKYRTIELDQSGKRISERIDELGIPILAQIRPDLVLTQMDYRLYESTWVIRRMSDGSVLAKSEAVPEQYRGGPQYMPSPLISVSQKKFFHQQTVPAPGSQILVARDLEALRVLWTFPVRDGQSFLGMSLSPDGKYLAVACGNPFTNKESVLGSEIVILESSSGEIVNSIPVNGSSAIAVSCGGKYLAIGRTISHGKERADMSVSLYHLMSRGKLAEVNHDRVDTRATGLLSRFERLEFSADSKYLFAFALNSTMWQIAPEM